MLEAAIQTLATGGSRALTHRAVDGAAVIPTGATSNLFRTRKDLVSAVIDHLIAADHARVAAVLKNDHPSPGVFAAAFIRHTLATAPHHVLARAALLTDPDSARLKTARTAVADAVTTYFRSFDVELSAARARLLVASIDGILLDGALFQSDLTDTEIADALNAMFQAPSHS